MIIQGSNIPIVFCFPIPVTSFPDISVSLYTDKELKHWNKEDLEIVECDVIANLTQQETLDFPVGKCSIEIKWLDIDGITQFNRIVKTSIMSRFDKTILEE